MVLNCRFSATHPTGMVEMDLLLLLLGDSILTRVFSVLVSNTLSPTIYCIQTDRGPMNARETLRSPKAERFVDKISTMRILDTLMLASVRLFS